MAILNKENLLITTDQLSGFIGCAPQPPVKMLITAMTMHSYISWSIAEEDPRFFKGGFHLGSL